MRTKVKGKKYKGLYFKTATCKIDPGTTEKIWYGRYTDEATKKVKEVSLGREISDGITKDDARIKLNRFRNGDEISKNDQRKQEKANQEESTRIAAAEAAESLEGCWQYYINGGDDPEDKRQEKAIYRSERGNFYNHLIPLIGHLKPMEITKADWNRLKKQLDGKLSKHGKPLSKQSQKHVMALLRRICDAIGRPLPKSWKMTRVVPKRYAKLSEKQLAKYLHVLEIETINKPVAEMLLVIFFTGARSGSICKLAWSEIDWTDGHYPGGSILLRETKNDDDVVIPLPSRIRELLQAKRARTKPTPIGDVLIWPDGNGRVRKSISHVAKRLALEADLPQDFRPAHGWRNQFISNLVDNKEEQGYSITTVQKLADHRSLASTLRYLTDDKKEQKKASEFIGGMYGNLSGK